MDELESYLCEDDDAILTVRLGKRGDGMTMLYGEVRAAGVEVAFDYADTLPELLEALGQQVAES